MSFLTLDKVSHHYFSKNTYTKALDNISFTIKEGEFISLLGPSGCGKSTLLAILAGIMEQTSGNVLLKKKPIADSKLAIGYMLQQDYLFQWKTIKDNCIIGPTINNNTSADKKQQALDLLHEVGSTDVADAYPDSLTERMRHRVALVCTLVTNPEVLLL